MARTRGDNGGSDPEDAATLERIRQVLIRAVQRHCPPPLAAHREDFVQMALIRLLERTTGEETTARGTSYLWRVAYAGSNVRPDSCRRASRGRRGRRRARRSSTACRAFRTDAAPR